MKKIVLLFFYVFVILGSYISHNALAAESKNQADVVKKEVLDGFKAYNNRDAKSLAKLNFSTAYSFEPDGSVLKNGFHEKDVEKEFNAGFKPYVKCHDIKVHIYNKTAIVTGYISGKFKLPNGKVEKGTWRMSMVWLRTHNNKWKAIHWHVSRLMSTA